VNPGAPDITGHDAANPLLFLKILYGMLPFMDVKEERRK
jgi:isocitrate/isopropylmalate dehydrogenase